VYYLKVLILTAFACDIRLNLAMASRAHLLEPHWNPMVEAQAAARIDRLDQDKDIIIYHYVVKQSIEEVIELYFAHQVKI
jgi:SNF2 family DNA or RNA helicase